MSAAEEKWILCPVCGAKTRLRLLRKVYIIFPEKASHFYFKHFCYLVLRTPP